MKLSLNKSCNAFRSFASWTKNACEPDLRLYRGAIFACFISFFNVALSDGRLEAALQETSVSEVLSTRGEFLGGAAPPELVHITRQRARGSAFVYPSQALGEPPNFFANFWVRTLEPVLKNSHPPARRPPYSLRARLEH